MDGIAGPKNPTLFGVGVHRAEIEVRPPTFSIGRGTECSLVIPDAAISRQHCTFIFDGVSWWIRDKSKLGTFVNGEKMVQGLDVPVFEGVHIKMDPQGRFVYIFSFLDRMSMLNRFVFLPAFKQLIQQKLPDPTGYDEPVRGFTPPDTELVDHQMQVFNPPIPRLQNNYGEPSTGVLRNVPAATGYDQAINLSCNGKRLWPETAVSSQPTFRQQSDDENCSTIFIGRPKRKCTETNDFRLWTETAVSNQVAYRQQSDDECCSTIFIGCPKRKCTHTNAFRSNEVPPLVRLDDNCDDVTSHDTDDIPPPLIPIGERYQNTFQTFSHHDNGHDDDPGPALEDQVMAHDASWRSHPNSEENYPKRDGIIIFPTGFDPGLRHVGEDNSRPQANVHYMNGHEECLKSEEIQSNGRVMRQHDVNSSAIQSNSQPCQLEIGVPSSSVPVESRMKQNIPVLPSVEQLYDQLKCAEKKYCVEVDKNAELAKGVQELVRKNSEMSEKLAINTMKMDDLTKQLQETRESKNALADTTKQQESKIAAINDLVDSELQCSICSEIFIEPVTLNCCHMFCKFCIGQWQERTTSCPMCRAPITSLVQSIPVTTFIEKVMEFVSDEMKSRRFEMIAKRTGVGEVSVAEDEDEEEEEEEADDEEEAEEEPTDAEQEADEEEVPERGAEREGERGPYDGAINANEDRDGVVYISSDSEDIYDHHAGLFYMQ